MYRGEWFNTLSHLAGAIAAAIGLVFLFLAGERQGDRWLLTAFLIYGVSLVILYTLSTLYHGLSGPAKAVCRRLEHCGIYILIAGTYTPFALVTLRGFWGMLLLTVNWGLAFYGIAYEHLRGKGRRIIPVVIYLIMGWMAVVAWSPLVQALAPAGFTLLLAGGILYTTGVIFYALDSWRPHYHGIWHMFVLAGSASHYFAVLLYVT